MVKNETILQLKLDNNELGKVSSSFLINNKLITVVHFSLYLQS